MLPRRAGLAGEDKAQVAAVPLLRVSGELGPGLRQSRDPGLLDEGLVVEDGDGVRLQRHGVKLPVVGRFGHVGGVELAHRADRPQRRQRDQHAVGGELVQLRVVEHQESWLRPRAELCEYVGQVGRIRSDHGILADNLYAGIGGAVALEIIGDTRPRCVRGRRDPVIVFGGHRYCAARA